MAASLLGGAGYSLILGESLRYPDETEYYLLGGNLVSRLEYTFGGVKHPILEQWADMPTAFRSPGYPFAIALLRWVGLGVRSVRMLNFACLALSIFLLYSVVQTQKRALAGVMAGLLVLCYPVLVYAAGTLYPQSLASALLLFVIWMCVRDVNWRRDLVFGGLALGYLILTVPYFLLVAPLLSLHPWALGFRCAWKRAILLAAVAACVTLPWTVRNYLVFHHFVAVSTNGGHNLLLGNNENTRTMLGGGLAAVDLKVDRYLAEAQPGQLANEATVSKYLGDRAMQWVRTHKWEAVKLYLRKWLYHFSFRNDLGNPSEGSWAKDAIMLVTYGSLLGVFLLRLALARRHSPSRLEWMLIGLYLANAFLSALFFPRIRFRLPFDFVLIGVVALYLDLFLAARQARTGRTPIEPVAAEG